MAKKKKCEECVSGAPAWMATYGDMVTLLLCFFVLLFSMSSVDVAKFKAAMSSFADQIDVLPGGESLTDGELLNNGISQLNDIQIIFQGGMPVNDTGEDTKPSATDSDSDAQDQMSEIDNIEQFELAGKIAKEFEEMIQQEGLEATIGVTFTSNYVKFTLQGEFLFDSGRATLKTQAIDAIDVIANILKKEDYQNFDIQIEGHTDDLPISNIQFPNNWILSSYRAYAVLEELIETHDFDPVKIAATGYGEYRPIDTNDTAEGRSKNRRVEIKVVLDSQEYSIDELTTEELSEAQAIDSESDTTVDETVTDETETTTDETVNP